MTRDEKIALWYAINAYALACGGDPSEATCPGNTHRMDAVVQVEKVVERIAYPSFMGEALNSGDGSYRP